MKSKLFILALGLMVSGLKAKKVSEEQADCPIATQEQELFMSHEKNQPYVLKKVLANGMTVLVRPVHTLPKVSLQIWYKVGAKDEKTSEKGIAHLIEHMIFKGTKQLSESDINIITHMLSGSTNAFTSWDYTGYLFNLPKQHWHEALAIFADSMQNVSFKDDHLNSEMKAVIQELKMNRDNYQRSLVMDMLASIFPDHPYHYPVIGFKQDLFDVHADRLRAFYKKHYWPNNATLVIVGDVDPDDVFEQAKKYFEQIPANKDYKKEQFYYNKDLISHNVTLYRDIQQSTAAVGYVIPGYASKVEHLMDVFNLILAEGKGSRLYRKIVDELQLATSLAGFSLLLFDHGIYFILYDPKNLDDIPKINELIQEEIDSIMKEGISDQEYTRALKQARMAYYGLLESIETQAREIGKGYVATGDENFAFHFLDKPKKEVEQEIKDLVTKYFRSSFRHTGVILPLSESDKIEWAQMQKESDEYDVKFLAARPRTSPIEAPSYAKKIKPKDAVAFNFPKFSTMMLSNGLKVLYYENDATPKINLIMSLKARDYYDNPQHPGLYNFLTGVMQEGTKKYTAAELADELESRGMSLSITPGAISISMLASDLDKGLELLEEIITNPRFDEKEVEKVRMQILAEIKNFWDNPMSFSRQLINEQIYKGHPYSKNILGTKETIEKITKKDLVEFHKKYFSPDGAILSIVGDFDESELKSTLEKRLGQWKGSKVETISFPKLESIQPCQHVYPINRDQVVLTFAGLSVPRTHPDYDKLLLFDQIFSGGVLGSLHSKLYQLREQSGLFYNIAGSLVASSAEEPGMVMIRTIVSLDRLDEAEKAIKGVIEKSVNEITQEEFLEAKRALINYMVTNFESNQGMAALFLAMNRFGFPKDYYDTRAEKLMSITLDQVKEAVKKVLRNECMITLKVGRLEKQKNEK